MHDARTAVPLYICTAGVPQVYGEDPELMARMAVAFVTGAQGDHPFYIKARDPQHHSMRRGA